MEELKLILETIKTISGDASTVAIWWLLLDKALPAVVWLITFSGILIVIFRIIKAISVNSLAYEVRDLLEIGCPGPITASERKAVIKRINELLKK